MDRPDAKVEAWKADSTEYGRENLLQANGQQHMTQPEMGSGLKVKKPAWAITQS